jgi:hypothetical protein
MSEGTNLDKKYGRRDFLKMFGIGASAIAATQLLSACEKFTPEEMKLTFKEIGTGDAVPLNVSGESPRNIRFQYANSDIDKIQIRQKEGTDMTLPFKNGGETVRMLGEISDPTLYKITGKNPGLSSEITVKVYSEVTGGKKPNSSRGELDINDRSYALPVIVQNMSYFEDIAPSETNKSDSYNREDWRDIEKFGNGLAVGSLNKDIFTVYGFVSDARAVALK